MATYDTTAPTSGPRDQAPVGTHPARVYLVAEMGNQPNSFDPSKPPRPTLFVGLELVGTKMQDGRPFVVSKKLAISFFEKANLPKVVAGILGEVPASFNPKDLLGKPCMAVVASRTGKDGAKRSGLDSVVAVPSGFPVKKAENPLVYYDFHNPDPGSYAKLPAWLQKDIMGAVPDEAMDSHDNEDVPF